MISVYLALFSTPLSIPLLHANLVDPLIACLLAFISLRISWAKVPHQLCQFHYLKDAIDPLYEADRHAKTQLKKKLRGVRPIERALEQHSTPENQAIRGYCLAVRASLTDDGRSPLQPSGLKLFDRITQIYDSIARVQEKKDCAYIKAVAATPWQRIASDGIAVAAPAAVL